MKVDFKYLFNSARLGLLLALTFVFESCSVNPFTGKKTIALIPNSSILPLSNQEYDKFLSENKVVSGTLDSERIIRVGKKLTEAAELWLNANQYNDYLNDYNWEYTLVQKDLVNAWCMPGGKIVFFTGILPITQNETGIATVMSHEIAHALANHGQQRMSVGLLQFLGSIAGNLSIKDEKDRAIFNIAYAIGSNYGAILPFSRSHETEADEIGINLMAIAGYDPYEASKFWERMKLNSKGKKTIPEFFSTHPSSDKRIKNLKLMAPKAVVESKKYID